MNQRLTQRITLAILGLALAACGDSSTANGDPSSPSTDSFPAGLFVDAPPEGAIGVRAAIAAAEEGRDIVFRGVVGGRKKVFVDSRAILIAIDSELQPCHPDEGCPTPWDYCCDTPETLLANSVSVQVVDADGAPIEQTLEGAHGLRPLSNIVVAGVVRTAGESVVIDAKHIHVEPQ